MQLALRDGDPQRTLALAREHELHFPHGILVPERDGARALALCASSASAAATKIGQAFLDTHPGSPLAARVRSACSVRER
jgi:hypothetical protein